MRKAFVLLLILSTTLFAGEPAPQLPVKVTILQPKLERMISEATTVDSLNTEFLGKYVSASGHPICVVAKGESGYGNCADNYRPYRYIPESATFTLESKFKSNTTITYVFYRKERTFDKKTYTDFRDKIGQQKKQTSLSGYIAIILVTRTPSAFSGEDDKVSAVVELSDDAEVYAKLLADEQKRKEQLANEQKKKEERAAKAKKQ